MTTDIGLDIEGAPNLDPKQRSLSFSVSENFKLSHTGNFVCVQCVVLCFHRLCATQQFYFCALNCNVTWLNTNAYERIFYSQFVVNKEIQVYK